MTLRHLQAADIKLNRGRFSSPCGENMDCHAYYLNHERTIRNSTTTPAIIALPISATEYW
jgi:hypothetical protein